MTLRAKKPIEQPQRFQAVVYANRGVGKTHFCCSFPDSYYIDTEGLQKYRHFTKMLIDNNSVIIYVSEMTEIIQQIKELIKTKIIDGYEYKTVVIDSITFPFHLLANMEAERLSKGGKTEGVEYGINLAKAKRLTFELGMLISRLDMNCIITAHERTKFQDGNEIGKMSDVNDKLEYAVGTVFHLRKTGKSVNAFIEKSRYPELKSGESIDFSDGYKSVSSILGKEIFERETVSESLATLEQIEEFNRLDRLLNISEEKRNKWIQSFRAYSIDQLSSDNIQKCIDAMSKHFNGKQKIEETV